MATYGSTSYVNIVAGETIKAGEPIILSSDGDGWQVYRAFDKSKHVNARSTLKPIVGVDETTVVGVAELDGPGWVTARLVPNEADQTWSVELDVEAILHITYTAPDGREFGFDNRQQVQVGTWSIGPFSSQVMAEMAANDALPLLASCRFGGLSGDIEITLTPQRGKHV